MGTPTNQIFETYRIPTQTKVEPRAAKSDLSGETDRSQSRLTLKQARRYLSHVQYHCIPTVEPTLQYLAG